MLLTIAERLMVQSVLPSKSDYLTLCVARDVRDAVDFTQDEIAMGGIRATEKGYKWAPEVDTDEADIELGEAETGLIVIELKKLNEGRSLTDNHYSIYRKFVLGEKE